MFARFLISFLTFFLLLGCNVSNQIKGNFGSSNGFQLSIESKPDGTGVKYKNILLTTNSPDFEVHAIARDSNNQVINPKVSWVLTGNMGNLDIQNGGKSARLHTLKIGEGSIELSYQGVKATYSVVVEGEPLAVTDLAYTYENTLVTISPLENDKVDVGEGPLNLISHASASNGTIVRNGDNLEYTPGSGFKGQDTFSYIIENGKGVQKAGLVKVNVVTATTWTGLGANNLWSNMSNWCGNIVSGQCQGDVLPGSGDIVVFDGTCEQCDVSIDTAVTVSGLLMESSFTGTITQSNSITVTVGSDKWIQKGGTFIGGDSTISLFRFHLFGGSFVSTTGTLLMEGATNNANGTDNTDAFVKSGGVFDANGGTVEFAWRSNYGTHSGNISGQIGSIDAQTDLDFHHFVLNIDDTQGSDYNHAKLNIIGPSKVSVLGDLTLNDGRLSVGEVDLYGDLYINCPDGSYAAQRCAGGGFAKIRFVNNLASQSIVQSSDGRAPIISIDGPTVNVTATNTDLYLRKLQVNQGTFLAPMGTLYFIGDVPIDDSTANIDAFVVSPGGTFNHNNGTVRLSWTGGYGTHQGNVHGEIGTIDVDGSLGLNHLVIDVDDTYSPHDHAGIRVANGDVINILGNLTIRDGHIKSGEFALEGDLTLSCPGGAVDSAQECAGHGVDGIVRFTGNNGAQSIYHESEAVGPMIIIDGVSANVAVADNQINLRTFQLVNGSFTAPTGIMNLTGPMKETDGTDYSKTFVVASGTTFSHNNGTVKFSWWAPYGYNTGVDDGYIGIVDVPGSLDFYNLIIAVDDTSAGSGYNNAKLTIGAGDTLNVYGNLTLEDGALLGETVNVYGDVAVQCLGGDQSQQSCFGGGTTNINFVGSVPQAITQQTNSLMCGTQWSLNNSNGLTLGSNIDFGGLDLLLNLGVLDLLTFNMGNVNNTTINFPASINENSGDYTWTGTCVANGGAVCPTN